MRPAREMDSRQDDFRPRRAVALREMDSPDDGNGPHYTNGVRPKAGVGGASSG